MAGKCSPACCSALGPGRQEDGCRSSVHPWDRPNAPSAGPGFGEHGGGCLPPGATTLAAIPTAPAARPQSPRSHGDGEPRQDGAPAASGRKMQQILAVMPVSASHFLLKRVRFECDIHPVISRLCSLLWQRWQREETQARCPARGRAGCWLSCSPGPAAASGHSQGGTAGAGCGPLEAAITQPAGFVGVHLNYKAHSPSLWVKL